MWAYQKFFRGRTLKPRLELTISGRAEEPRALSNVFISVPVQKRGPLKGWDFKIRLRDQGFCYRSYEDTRRCRVATCHHHRSFREARLDRAGARPFRETPLMGCQRDYQDQALRHETRLLWDADPSKEICKAAIGAKRVPERLYFEVSKAIEPFLMSRF